MLILATFAVHAQKQPKPNLNKALGLMNEGKLQEAKEMLDNATTYEKTMNDGKTYYYRGLLFARLDTTKDEQVKSIEPDAFNSAIKSFTKADSLGGKKNEYYVQPTGALPVTKSQQMENWANFYLNDAINKYQNDNDPEASMKILDKATTVFETQLEKYANDTLAYYLQAIIGHQAEQFDKAIDAADKYFKKGGKSKDVYVILYQIYTAEGPKKDNEKALQVVQEAKKNLPNEPAFPKMEIELLINTGKEQEAKAGLEEAIKKEPEEKLLHFFLGYVNLRLGNNDEARKNFQEAIRIDPGYYEAQMQLANTYLADVEKVNKDFKATGNTPAESKKRQQLGQQRVQSAEVAIPYFEKLEKMKAPSRDDEADVLHKLALLYYYSADDKNSARVEKKLKAMGELD